MKRQLVLCLMSIALTGCAAAPELALSARQITAKETIKRADLIVIGTIQNIQVFGKSRQTNEGVKVRAWRVELDLAKVLRGHVEGRRLTYFFNNWDPGVVQNGSFERREKGERRIFFLAHEGPIVRAVADLYITSMNYPRSRVPDISGNQGEPMRQRIARVLLTPAAEESPHEFAATIPRATPNALRCAGYVFVASLLKRLAASQAPEISREACLTGYEQVFADATCIEAIERVDSDRALALRIKEARERRDYLRRLAEDETRQKRGSPLVS